MSAGADKHANTGGGGALERSHSAPLEPLAKLGDALSGVLAVTIIVEATELVVEETESGGRMGEVRDQVCQLAVNGR